MRTGPSTRLATLFANSQFISVRMNTTSRVEAASKDGQQNCFRPTPVSRPRYEKKHRLTRR